MIRSSGNGAFRETPEPIVTAVFENEVPIEANDVCVQEHKDDIYVFFFDKEGLMEGLGLQGTKITKITPEK